jgi:hypothetical protein
MQDALTQPHGAWDAMREDVDNAFSQHAGGRDVPYAITEHNLFSVQELDNGKWMTQMVNALFMADTLGQMMKNGFDLANQWDLANGQIGDTTDYGLMHADSYSRYPQYYVFPLWAGFGSEMIPVTNSENPINTLSVYAGRVDANTLSLLVINKSGGSISADISVEGVSGLEGGAVDVVQGSSLSSTSVTYNGVANPSNDLSNAPSTPLSDLSFPITQSFPKYSITLIQLDISANAGVKQKTAPTGSGFVTYLPSVLNKNATSVFECK